jgi:hypothetical protein
LRQLADGGDWSPVTQGARSALVRLEKEKAGK